MALTKSINTFTLLSSAIAGIVGSGWLLGPLVCVKIAGPAAILSWIIAGLLMMIVATTFVILARNLPMTGGTVRYFQLSYGHFAGYSFSWVAWLAWVAVSPIETMALLQYSANYLPQLMTHDVQPVLTQTGVLAAMALLSLISLLNSFSLHVYNKINHLILGFKLLIPTLTVIILCSTQFYPENITHSAGFMPFGIKSLFSALPLAGVIYSFIGFNPAIQLAAEAKNPKTAIPIAVFGALFICMTLYTFVQLAFVAALPPETLKQGWQHISFPGQNGPFAGLLASIGFVWFVKALYIDAAISPFGTALVQSMATSRLTYAMSQNGYFPAFLQKTNAHKAPTRAILLNLIVGFLFFLPFPSWQHMVGFLVSCLVLGYLVGPMSLLILCETHPEQFNDHSSRNIKIICLLALYVCTLIIYWTGWHTIQKLLLVFALGYVILGLKYTFSFTSRQELGRLDILRGSWILLYMAGLGALSYLSTFEGSGMLRFGEDFLAIAGFVILIYSLALYLAKQTPPPVQNQNYLAEDVGCL